MSKSAKSSALSENEVSENRAPKKDGTMRESEAQMRLLLNSTGEGIYGVDLAGDCTFCNQACLRLLAYDDVGELLGQNMHALIHHTRPNGTLYPVGECRIYQAFRERCSGLCHQTVPK